MGVVALAMVCTAVMTVQAVEMSGTTEIGVDLLPSLGTYVNLDATISGEAWTVVSDSDISVTPSFGGSEYLYAWYELDVAKFEVDVVASLAPFGLDTVDAYLTVNLFESAFPEEDSAAEISSDVIVGAVFEEAADPYVGLYTLASCGDHWLSNTTTLSLAPLDVASEILAYLSFGPTALGESGATVTAYGYISTDIIPLDFSYAQLNVKLSVDEGSILNTVTYYGGDSFVDKLTITLDLGAAGISTQGSYSSASSTPFGFGIYVSFPWTLLE